MLAGRTSNNFLFSPNFRYLLDVDYGKSEFMIKDVLNHGKIVDQIPNGLLDLCLGSKTQSQSSVGKLAKRICFKDNEHLKLIN